MPSAHTNAHLELRSLTYGDGGERGLHATALLWLASLAFDLVGLGHDSDQVRDASHGLVEQLSEP